MSPREAEAVSVAADALDGAGDPAALVVALVAELARRGRLPEREVAVVLAGLIEGHPEGAGLVRCLDALAARRLDGDLAGFVQVYPGWWRALDVNARTLGDYATREAAEAALIATQPEPRAVVRRSA